MNTETNECSGVKKEEESGWEKSQPLWFDSNFQAVC